MREGIGYVRSAGPNKIIRISREVATDPSFPFKNKQQVHITIGESGTLTIKGVKE